MRNLTVSIGCVNNVAVCFFLYASEIGSCSRYCMSGHLPARRSCRRHEVLNERDIESYGLLSIFLHFFFLVSLVKNLPMAHEEPPRLSCCHSGCFCLCCADVPMSVQVLT